MEGVTHEQMAVSWSKVYLDAYVSEELKDLSHRQRKKAARGQADKAFPTVGKWVEISSLKRQQGQKMTTPEDKAGKKATSRIAAFMRNQNFATRNTLGVSMTKEVVTATKLRRSLSEYFKKFDVLPLTPEQLCALFVTTEVAMNKTLAELPFHVNRNGLGFELVKKSPAHLAFEVELGKAIPIETWNALKGDRMTKTLTQS